MIRLKGRMHEKSTTSTNVYGSNVTFSVEEIVKDSSFKNITLWKIDIAVYEIKCLLS